MSIKTSDTTTKNGLVQFYEKEIGANYGDVSGNANKLAEFIARANTTLDKYLMMWAMNSHSWQGDDINHSDFNIVTATLTSGQRDYSFTTDETGNRIFDVTKVLFLPSTTATNYDELQEIDELRTSVSDILVNTVQGVPYQYGKLGSSILIDPIPNYTVASGIKMVISREGSYFATTDTTKVVGVPSFHEYFYLRPAYEYARIHGLSNLKELEKAVIDLEGSERLGVMGKIPAFFKYREKDFKKGLHLKKIKYI